MCVSVGLVRGKQRGVHRLHAGGAGEGPHQPVVYTVHVVDVHAGQEPDGVSVYKVHHTDDALSDLLLRGVPAGVVHALREVLDEPDSLCDANLLLLSQLSGQSCLAGCWVVDGHMDLLLQKRERERIPNRKVRLNNYFVGRIQREKKSLVTIIVSGWWQEI